MGLTPSNSYYERHADFLVTRYESLTFAQVHKDLSNHIPISPGAVLDVGSGSGRDASYFADQGLFVVAVEPSETLRGRAQRLHPNQRIIWVDDSLPNLSKIHESNMKFNFILLSAVWMHIPQRDRMTALSAIEALLVPRGKVAVSLRIGEADSERAIHAVDPNELLGMAEEVGLSPILITDAEDQLRRENITWITIIMQR